MSNTKESNLQGKVALVTGASKGIGAAIARELAARGASVAVNYSGSKAGADKVVAEIKAAGGNAIAVQANLADPDSIGPLVATVARELGSIDVLVNNAGIYEFGPLELISPEHFHKQFNINVLGLLLVTQALPTPPSTAPPRARSTPSPAHWPRSSARKRSVSTL